MYDFTKQDIFKKCQRSFNVRVPLDNKFVDLIKHTNEEFISNENLDINSFVITNESEIKLIHSCAIFEHEAPNLAWKTNTQVLAPMLIMCTPKKNNDMYSMMQIGRLQTKLGMLAIEHGYLTGFCCCFKVSAMSCWDTLKKYIQFDESSNRIITPITLSIGKPFDTSKPHNWSHVHQKFHGPHIRTDYTNITVAYPEE
jgi:hypothetical protein